MTEELEKGEPAQTEFDAEGQQRFLQQVLDLWVNPEVERRRQAGTLPTSFELLGAQIIMNVGEPTTVRLNDDVRAVMKPVLTRPPESFKKGDPVYWEDIDHIDDIQLTDQDPNAGHVTLLRAGPRWLIVFDFRYNAERIEELLRAAEEFLAAAENAQVKGHGRAFMENLFAAVELTAKGRLMLHPDERLLTSQSHRFIGTKMNLHAHLGNVDRAFVDLLNELTRKRGPARYVEGKVDVEPGRMEQMAEIARSNLEALKQGLPKRFPVRGVR